MRYEFDADLRRLILQTPSLARSNNAHLKLSHKQKTFDNSSCETADHSIAFLLRFGLPQKMLRRATALAKQNGTCGARELIAFNGIEETEYYRLLARHLNTPFVEANEIKRLVDLNDFSMSAFAKGHVIWGDLGEGILRPIIAPDPRQVLQLEKIFLNGSRNEKVVLTAPSILRSIAAQQQQGQLASTAINLLYTEQPEASARTGASAWQGAIISISMIAIAFALSFSNGKAGLIFHLFLSVFFMACASIRMLAFASFAPTKFEKIVQSPDKDKPVYSVMVALHDEADVVPDLITSLKKLKWPRSKLEIKLICEADDLKTVEVIKEQALDPRFEIILVPPSTPRTKPKALCYALGFTSGNFITLYDAEDRPHPEQLLEAFQKFGIR